MPCRDLGELGPRIFTGQPEFFTCLDPSCLGGRGFEWREPLPKNGTVCPKCGSLYVEWNSYDIEPWFVLERGTMPRGEIKITVLREGVLNG